MHIHKCTYTHTHTHTYTHTDITDNSNFKKPVASQPLPGLKSKNVDVYNYYIS